MLEFRSETVFNYYNTLVEWWNVHNFPVLSIESLPDNIYIVSREGLDLYAIPVYITDSNWCIIGFPTSNKMAPKEYKKEFYNDNNIGLPFHQGVGSYGDVFPVHNTFCSIPGREAKEGNILFSVRAPVGRLNIADRNLIIGRGLSAMTHKKGYNAFLWETLKYNFTKEDIIGNGAIFNSVSKNELFDFKIIYPSEGLIKQFENQILPIHNQIKNLYVQINNLKKTRDLLLPRLISGTLKIASE